MAEAEGAGGGYLVDVLMVDDLNAQEVGRKVKEWADFCIYNNQKDHI